MSTQRVAHIFNVPVHTWPRQQVLEAIDANIRGDRIARHICITSSELMFHARRQRFIPEYARRSYLSLCDSTGVALNGIVRGTMTRRFTGPQLMEEAFRFGAARGWRHFFCGGAEGVAEQLSRRMAERFPGFITAGTYCPPFGEQSAEQEAEMIACINAARPDILWVGLGVVKQERWIEKYTDALQVPWQIGVGGAFDYFAGTVPRAPRAVRAIGMEWCYRLCREPWRYKRISTNLIFGMEGLIEAIFGRAPYVGAKPSNEIRPPEWKGKRKELQKQ